MGIDWEKSFRHYLSKKFKEMMGIELPLDAIGDIVMDFDIDYSVLDLHDLGVLYSLAITVENFETAEKILKEFEKRNCTVKLTLDEKKGCGTVDIYVQPEVEIKKLAINLVVTPDGMMIDWDKENF